MRKFLKPGQIVILIVVIAALIGGFQWVAANSNAPIPPDLREPSRERGGGANWLE